MFGLNEAPTLLGPGFTLMSTLEGILDGSRESAGGVIVGEPSDVVDREASCRSTNSDGGSSSRERFQELDRQAASGTAWDERKVAGCMRTDPIVFGFHAADLNAVGESKLPTK